ncbi:MAG: glycosyltransferase [Bacteroidales bacterium]|nr:glycosyltransferase [Bacteroidales bacterium]
MTYSIAIRTLGTAGEKYIEELRSISRQTVQPEKVVVYIAEGYSRPEETIGKEEYIWVKKGMVAQRALRYEEITSDCILLLDDDVRLAPDSVERLLKALEENDLDCVAADVFKNHEMPLATKVKAALSNWVFPHGDKQWAFKMRGTGSFSYNRNPEPRCYLSQSCGGPAMLWRKEALLRTRLEDELWMDSLGFAYGDDALISYKLYKNGGRLGVLYDSGVDNLDAGSSSSSFKKSADRVKVIAKATTMIWWRSIYRNGEDTRWSRLSALFCFAPKIIWQLVGMTILSVFSLSPKIVLSYCRGIMDGIRSSGSNSFTSLSPFIQTKKS